MYHSFVDESKKPYYLLAAALVRPAHLAQLRQTITGFVMPGQRRIHFFKESERRRAQIMARLEELPIDAVIYESTLKINEKAARDRCLGFLIRDHLARDVRRLVIEREDSRVDADRQILRSELAAADATDRVAYEHLRAHEDLLLCVPDAIAWCWARGGHWRIKAKGLVTDVCQA